MGENTGLIMFLWIVGAPTIGFVVLSFWGPKTSARAARETDRNARDRRYASGE